jgi:hypothetical protein
MTADQYIESPTEPKSNPFSRMLGVLLSPFETMAEIGRRPDWLVPLLTILILSIGTGFLTAPHIDFETETRVQLEKRGMSPQQIDQQMAMISTFQKYTVPFTAAFIPITLLIIAGVLLLAFKVMGGEGGFKQAFSVTAYAWIPLLLKGLIATFVIMQRQSVTPTELIVIVRSNLGFLANPVEEPAKFALLASLDLFTFWTMLLLAIGFAALSRFTLVKSAIIIVSLWLVVTVARVGMAAAFS